MKCYRCDSTLSDNNFCNSCGANVVEYKKVVKLSNTYYNMGLAKARLRDLTGACELLRRSVRFNKKNTNARNLLGLVYFEMGEAVQAFSEWVISKNIQSEKNLADDYIKRLQSNPVRLDTINQTIRKYNLALNYAKQGSDDVAVIQLKKVLNTNPNLVKGHLLLCLLYMKKGDFERAKKPVMKVLKIDTNNPLAKKYLGEIENQTDVRKLSIDKDTKVVKNEEKLLNKPLNGNDVIIPKRNIYKESNSGMMTVINVVIGLVIGVVMAYFLLIPAKEKTLTSTHNKEILKLNSQIDNLNTSNLELQGKIEALEGEKSTLNGQLTNKNDANEQLLGDYSSLIEAVTFYNSNDFINCALSLNKIKDSNRSEKFKGLYDIIRPESYKQAAVKYFETGKSGFYSSNSIETWETTIGDLSSCFQYDFMQINYVDAVDKLGIALEKQYELAISQSLDTAGQYKEKALAKLADLVNNVFPNTENIDQKAIEKAQEHIGIITSK